MGAGAIDKVEDAEGGGTGAGGLSPIMGTVGAGITARYTSI